MSTGVIIPSNVRKTVNEIKEIAAGKHTDEDIYTMLKECNMDPNETAQKLLYLDTFHEVKRKRDRKKVSKASSQISEDYRWMSGIQRRRRDGRDIISANYITDDASGRRYIKKENGVYRSKDRSSKTSMPAARKTEDANSMHPSKESVVEVAAEDPSHVTRVTTTFVNVTKLPKVSTTSRSLTNHHRSLDPGPTPAPTPTFAPGTRFKDKVFISRPNELVTSKTSASVSGVYSSASDPVLVPALNPRNLGTVGRVKREIGSQRTTMDSTVSPANEGRLDVCQGDPRNTHAVITTVNYINTTGPKESRGVSTTAIQPVAVDHESHQHSKQVKGQSGVLPSQAAAVAKGAHIPSLSKLNSSVEQAVPQLDMKLEKLNICVSRQPVIFPNHLQVPESFRSRLTFGSLDPQLDPSISCDKDSIPAETLPANDSSMEVGSYEDASSAVQEGDYPDNLLSRQHGSENTSPFEVSGSSPVNDPSKPEKCPPSAGSQLPLLQTTPDYSLGFVPPMLGPQLVCFEGPEQQGGNSQAPSTMGSNQPVAQPIGLGQSSASVPPHLFPLVRQPFPPNYMPYNPYIPHLYMPQGAHHQFLGPSGFPQQPSAPNFYMSPSVTAAGVKLPLPSLYKPTAITGNLNHFGIPTGYSSYGSSTVSYSGTPALVCSASNENLTTPELKERNVYSIQKQNEDSHYRNSVPGCDQSMLQTNYFYNIPQDHQHVAVTPAHSSNSSFPGINPSQTIVAQSHVQPLAQQPQTVARSGDSGLPTSGAFQQPQPHWNNKLLNRENV